MKSIYVRNDVHKEDETMSSINVTNARKNLCRLVENLAETHEPVHITGRSSSAVLIGEDDWRSIEETLYLQSIPGMRNSIAKGMKEPLQKGSTKLEW
jgi:antitoxin YefM